MVANLNRTYIVGFRRMPLRFETARDRLFNGARMFLDPTKRSQNLAGSVENRWQIAFSRECFVPGRQ